MNVKYRMALRQTLPRGHPGNNTDSPLPAKDLRGRALPRPWSAAKVLPISDLSGP